jgi:hypothetical protein
MATDDDDDILIPRRLHSEACGPSSNQNVANLSIDPEMLERRHKRKQALKPQPSGGSVNEKPWVDFDRGLAARIPAFNQPMWTLGDVARWMVERTPQAVNGLSIDEEKLPEALTEIHDALSKGQIAAWSTTILEPVPRELPAATWSIYVLGFEEKNGLLHPCIVHSAGSPDARPLKDLRFKSVEVRRHWPGAEPEPPTPTTAASQLECKRWLLREMGASPDRPRPKKKVWIEARNRFPKLSKRGFERAWSDAINTSGAEKWSKAGPRSS